MPTPTYVAIAKTVLSADQTDVTFSAIPSTYTDLLLVISARSSDTGNVDRLKITVNASATNYSNNYVYANGTTATAGTLSGGNTYIQMWGITANGATANSFGNAEVYLPNYTGSTNKVLSVTGAAENNSATAYYEGITAGLWSNTSAITSITLDPVVGADFKSGSRFDLYGIKNS
jgi:hypothetical protein